MDKPLPDCRFDPPCATARLLRRNLDEATHKIITCGVAASHPDPLLSTRDAYGDKWDSPQAQEVRELRGQRDALAAALRELMGAINMSYSEEGRARFNKTHSERSE